jgi:hypothetical protein
MMMVEERKERIRRKASKFFVITVLLSERLLEPNYHFAFLNVP